MQDARGDFAKWEEELGLNVVERVTADFMAANAWVQYREHLLDEAEDDWREGYGR